MAFEKKIWKDRIAEFINRRVLTKEDGSTELVTVARSEGTVSQEGDAFNAATMNDLEDRVAAEFASQNDVLVQANTNLSKKLDNNYYDNPDVKKGIRFDNNADGSHFTMRPILNENILQFTLNDVEDLFRLCSNKEVYILNNILLKPSFLSIKNGTSAVEIWSDNEGGNIALTSPNGQRWEMDAHSDKALRIFTYGSTTNGNAVKSITINEHGEIADGYGNYLHSVAGEVNNLKKSVSDGKAAVAKAITEQGVGTASNAAFSTMAANIGTVGTNKWDEGYKNGLVMANGGTPVRYGGNINGAVHYTQTASSECYLTAPRNGVAIGIVSLAHGGTEGNIGGRTAFMTVNGVQAALAQQTSASAFQYMGIFYAEVNAGDVIRVYGQEPTTITNTNITNAQTVNVAIEFIGKS